MADKITPRQRYVKRHQALRNERTSWVEHWRELSDYIQPRRSRFLNSDRNSGAKRNQKIINGTPTYSHRTLTAGMMAGITSPARPWFRLTTPDPDLAEFGAVRSWLSACEDRLRTAFQRSNIYNALYLVYSDLALFGTAALHIEEDAEDFLRAYCIPIGQYCLANSARLRVDSIYREVSMTVAQVVQMFGLPNCSERVKSAHDTHNSEQWIDVLHVIEPNTAQDMEKMGRQGMPFRSCWMEANGSELEGFLREGGYEEFPALCPRWAVTGEDVYGSSPAMDALGDSRALQLLEKRKMQALDKIVSPPMRGPASLMNQKASLLPGDITYVSEMGPGQVFAPAMEINPIAIQYADASIREHENRIKRSFHADLWLMMASSDDPGRTAREIAERHEEKMLQLGPVVERVQDELLDPLIDRAFGIMLRNGQLPPPPKELEGQDLRTEYLSMMAQAQKMIGIGAVDRLFTFAIQSAANAQRPDILDKLDFDQAVDEYSNMLGTPPAVVRSDEDVEAIRAERQQAQAKRAQMEQAAATLQAGKTLADTSLEGDNALNRLLSDIGAPPASGPN